MSSGGQNGGAAGEALNKGVRAAHFDVMPSSETVAKAHGSIEDSLMTRRKTVTSYGAAATGVAATGSKSQGARSNPFVERISSDPTHLDDKLGKRSASMWYTTPVRTATSLHGSGHPHMSQISQYTEGLRDGLSGIEGYWSGLNYLLISVPFGILCGLFKGPKTLIFILNFIACIPLATILGKATEDLAAHTNETVGGLLNATFGNAVELILSIAALRAGLLDVIRYTLVGSILSNLLLVLGSSFFFGGLLFREQEVHKVVAESNADLLVTAAFGFVLPTVFGVSIPEGENRQRVAELFSLVTALCMLLIYGMFLYFQLFTHYDSYLDAEEDDEEGVGSRRSVTAPEEMDEEGDIDEEEEEEDVELIASFPVAMAILIVDVIFVSICSEYIVDSIEEFSLQAGLGQTFVSLIFLPIIGNAVEHFSAVMVAMKDKMDLSIGIACGSSVQIAAFASPVMVLLSWMFGKYRLTLDVGLFNAVCIVMSVFLVNTTMRDSKTNWLEGALLLTVYVVIGCALFLFDKV